MATGDEIAAHLTPPYYAVIFTSQLRPTPHHTQHTSHTIHHTQHTSHTIHHTQHTQTSSQHTLENPTPYNPPVHPQSQSQLPNYHTTAAAMVALGQQQEGYLGMESVRGESGLGITVSYWQTAEAIKRWKENVEHLFVQRRGREEWYSKYRVRVCYVGREYGFEGVGVDVKSKM